jgi:hypothetical protein
MGAVILSLRVARLKFEVAYLVLPELKLAPIDVAIDDGGGGGDNDVWFMPLTC